MASEDCPGAAAHAATITDQFTRQAQQFAQARALHGAAALELLVNAADPCAEDVTLDVACGPGSIVAAFAARVRRAEGLDATAAMLEEAKRHAESKGLGNVAWHRGSVEALPFASGSFDIVSCRFALHHFERPLRAFGEMVRVCRPGGRIVLCDAYASDDPAKAAAFNAMERYRDPSTVELRTRSYLRALFEDAGLVGVREDTYAVQVETERVIAMSYPVDGDRAGVRRMIEASVDGDTMGIGAYRDGGTVRFAYPAVVIVAAKAA